MFTIGAAAGGRFLTRRGRRGRGIQDRAQPPIGSRRRRAVRAWTRTWCVYGADGQKESGGQGSYFVTIAKNLTVDGWVVIGICLAMLVIALIIMVIKALFLTPGGAGQRRISRTNFARLSGDAAALDDRADEGDEEDLDDAPSMASLRGDQNKYGASTLYRLYHHGVREVEQARCRPDR